MWKSTLILALAAALLAATAAACRRAGSRTDRRAQVGRHAEGEGRRLPPARPRRHQERRPRAGRPAGRREALAHGPLRPGDRSPIRRSTTPSATRWARLKGRPLVGVIGSLGVRRDAKAVDAMAKLLADSDADVAQSAARALGKIGTPEAAKALEAALAGAPAANQVDFCEGLFRCAEALSAEGQAAQSLAIYDRLREPVAGAAAGPRGGPSRRDPRPPEGRHPPAARSDPRHGLRPDGRRRAGRRWKCPARKSPRPWPANCPNCPSTSRSCWSTPSATAATPRPGPALLPLASKGTGGRPPGRDPATSRTWATRPP